MSNLFKQVIARFELKNQNSVRVQEILTLITRLLNKTTGHHEHFSILNKVGTFQQYNSTLSIFHQWSLKTNSIKIGDSILF